MFLTKLHGAFRRRIVAPISTAIQLQWKAFGRFLLERVFYEIDSKGRLRAASRCYRILLSIWPGNPDLRNRAAEILASQGALELAARWAEPGSLIHTYANREVSSVDDLRRLGDERSLALADSVLPIKSGPKVPVPLLILDTSFPSTLSGFRYDEFSTYLDHFPSSRVVSSVLEMMRYDTSTQFLSSLRSLLTTHPNALGRVVTSHRLRPLIAGVAYCVFLSNAARLIVHNPTLRARKFAFCLYPGGGFKLGDAASDEQLKLVLGDRRLAKVITTQSVSYRYLLDRGLVDPNSVEHIFGGIISEAWRSTPYPIIPAGDIIEVSFIAQRYTATGEDKGTPVVSDVAKALAGRGFRFHFVGDWSPETTGVDASEHVRYHGVLSASQLTEINKATHVTLSPNRRLAALGGGFDGFPLTASVGAAVQGNALLVSDPLGLNVGIDNRTIFKVGTDLEILEPHADAYVARLLHYRDDYDALSCMRLGAQRAVRRLFSFEAQMEPRLRLLRSLMS